MIPLFKTHYSIGKSILTAEPPEKSLENGPSSIFDIYKENNLKEIFVVEDSMAGFKKMYDICQENKFIFRFGLRITLTKNINEKTDESRNSDCKFIIFILNSKGYEDIVKIISKASIEGFYYYPRIDYESLKKLWTENLLLAIPFYDSFLFMNTLYYSTCIPNISFTKPVVFWEDNGLPFDPIIQKIQQKYADKNELEFFKTKTIYYKNKEDFKAYLTFRCIQSRTSLDRPNLNHMSSNRFNFQSFLEENN